MTGLEGVPPIEVYRIGDVYFVRDGNHRVSVARQLGAKMIQAYVTLVHSRVPVGPDVDHDALIIASEYASFLEETRLDHLRPEADLRVTAAGQYPTLLEHIRVHRYFMGIDEERPIPWEEAVGHWYDAVYLRVVEAIRSHGLMGRFPDRTETDLYLFLAEHRARLEEEFGWSLEGPALAEGLSARRSLDPQVRTEQLRAFSEAVAGREGGASLVDSVLILLQGEASDAQVVRRGLALAATERADAFALRLGVPVREEDAAAERSAFEAAAAAAAVRGQIAFTADEVVRAVATRAAYVDLVVAALPDEPTGVRRKSPLIRPLLRRCPKPLMLVAGEALASTRPLLAYDGGAKAEEALFILAYICLRQRLAPVVVSVAERGRRPKKLLDQAGDYLTNLGLTPLLVAERGAVDAALLRTLEAHGCDLLVMGSRRYSPWIEEVTGSLLDRIVAGAGVTLLIT